MWQYYIEPRKRRYVKGYGFLSFAKKCKKQLFGTDAVKTVSKKVVREIGEFLGNKIADPVTKSSDDNMRNKNLLKK